MEEHTAGAKKVPWMREEVIAKASLAGLRGLLLRPVSMAACNGLLVQVLRASKVGMFWSLKPAAARSPFLLARQKQGFLENHMTTSKQFILEVVLVHAQVHYLAPLV